MSQAHESPESLPELEPSPRTKLARHPERGSYDRRLVESIIDEALLCHVGFVHDGAPCVLPMAHTRIGRYVYLHGARANRMLRALLSGPAALTFTLLDGLVFARSAFHHSMNFRSVAVFGQALEVDDVEEKAAAAAALLEHMAQGRSLEARAPSEVELKRTLVLRIPIDEASAKVRQGPPLDDADDMTRASWAGVLPLRLQAGDVQRDPQLTAAQPIDRSVHARALHDGDAAARPEEWRRGSWLVSTERARLDLALITRFLADESYWVPGIARERVERGIAGSICFGLYDCARAQQIGFARVATDLTRVAYLADVFVLSEQRGQGLGSWLIECVLAHPQLAGVDRWFLGTRDAQAFYARFGFSSERVTRLMVRVRSHDLESP